jgi:hypothetical protein
MGMIAGLDSLRLIPMDDAGIYRLKEGFAGLVVEIEIEVPSRFFLVWKIFPPFSAKW